MNAQTEYLLQAGPAGVLEVAIDRPSGDPVGVAVLAHPHPLHGGTLSNKVVQTLARACVLAGWTAVRFNFRGVGRSEGTYDEGRGELADLLSVIEAQAPSGPLCLAGFSFGAFVTSHAASQLQAQREIRRLVLVGTAASRFEVAPVPAELHPRTLVIHGEQDDTVPLASVMAWARPQVLPVLVVPGGGHFFHGQLPLLRELVLRHLRA
ncbi:MAG: alpha/beta fold hydrolase [Hydrogenophaga sp.]|jgi:alpha/beta superfamily hydrolase|uniref:alpha/beta hydrolase n=1 Tax=Hydrogenophaga TaxID=47420 RepID=UPI001B380341|nr:MULTISPECIES: alpha/beta fold hydrolase [Hydrogenophaga]MBU4181138.1 alpha/beta fold hydrolase [Gammaproteobacteria bacterium]MBQ0919684.1 alpha/beta fold hydrolase [Hydrogenophaga aromaticivorans]MBU4281500.1 alpha/beta fold hydrolase [Gammaproteobacteria bacterium]MBU4324248.1 alpha/beta fold hydrolase [Gammaproteobacteria bacterium]MBU4506552.1 alpha/beta fold hydrolase [Gammaproteobacteria bacterium]